MKNMSRLPQVRGLKRGVRWWARGFGRNVKSVFLVCGGVGGCQGGVPGVCGGRLGHARGGRGHWALGRHKRGLGCTSELGARTNWALGRTGR